MRDLAIDLIVSNRQFRLSPQECSLSVTPKSIILENNRFTTILSEISDLSQEKVLKRFKVDWSIVVMNCC